MIGKVEIIGEWSQDGSLDQTGERRILNVQELKEAVKRAGDVDLQVILAGTVAILGVHSEDGERLFSLEVHIPLLREEGGECDLAVLESRTAALRELKSNGYYLEGQLSAVKCFKEGAFEELDAELDLIETSLASSE
ncbi:hypothetical protein [Methanomassiliicoccus luminyensis]|uniref:hypothetical protein n=1 Tax=Methanomassiliicoccus luminyensis TaxID=1080712 RepID=UPI00037540D9|nr:hypothetical protein [Methanomassiliicoccus luminyensis]